MTRSFGTVAASVSTEEESVENARDVCPELSGRDFRVVGVHLFCVGRSSRLLGRSSAGLVRPGLLVLGVRLPVRRV